MKPRNYGIVMISMLILLGTCFITTAESINEGTGDVYHYSQTGTAWSWRAGIADKPNIDITEISYSVNDDKLTLKLEVAGSIQNSEYYWYNMYYNSSDTIYTWWWSNGTGFGMASNQGQQAYDMIQNFTVTGNSISAEFNVLGDTATKIDLWGQAHHYTTLGSSQQTNEWWGDWAPNEKFIHDIEDDDTDGTDGTDDGLDDDGPGSETKTPGFEMVLVIAAVAVAFIILRKRR